jgi:hypothetical protein
VEHNRGAVDERQPHERVLEFFADLRPLENGAGVDRVAVVAPAFFDLFDQYLVTGAARPVDGQVVEDAVQPGGCAALSAEAGVLLECAHERLLHELVGGVGVADEREREAVQAWALGCDEGLERRTVEAARRMWVTPFSHCR